MNENFEEEVWKDAQMKYNKMFNGDGIAVNF